MSAHTRRGSTYVLVLGGSIVLMVVGMSALALARVQARSTAVNVEVTQARFYADAVLEIVMHRLADDSTWRSSLTHDVWTTPEVLGDLTFSYKLVDEGDGNLADDTTEPVRCYARAQLGDAVRLVSVELTPTGEPYNVLSNPGFENGTTDWTGSNCSLVAFGVDPQAGTTSLAVTSRVSNTAGPTQEVTDDIVNGASYEVSAWIRTASGTDSARLSIAVTTDSLGSWALSDHFAIGPAWTYVSDTLTPTWTGKKNSATFRIDTASSTASLVVDSVTLTPVGVAGPAMAIVESTWQRELE